MEIREITLINENGSIYTNGVYYLEYRDDELFPYKIIDKWDKYELVELINYIPYSDFWTVCLKPFEITKRSSVIWNPNTDQFPDRDTLVSILSSGGKTCSEYLQGSNIQQEQEPKQRKQQQEPQRQEPQRQEPQQQERKQQQKQEQRQKQQQPQRQERKQKQQQKRHSKQQQSQSQVSHPRLKYQSLSHEKAPSQEPPLRHHNNYQKDPPLLPLPPQQKKPRQQHQQQLNQKDQPSQQRSLPPKSRKALPGARGNQHSQPQQPFYLQQVPPQSYLSHLSHVPLSLAATTLHPLGVISPQDSYQRQRQHL